jgi:hypothetical protein
LLLLDVVGTCYLLNPRFYCAAYWKLLDILIGFEVEFMFEEEGGLIPPLESILGKVDEF